MKFLHDKRRAGILALLGTLIGAAALVMGSGAANATSAPCNDDPWGVGTYNDLWATAGSGPTSVFVGADPNVNENGYYASYVCFGAPGGEATQVALAAGITDPSTSPPGVTVQAFQCYAPLPGGSVGGSPTCRWLVAPTGGFVGMPTTGTTTSGSTPGGAAGTGSGTCVYANGSPPRPELCPTGLTIAGVNIATGDANVSTRTVPGGCIGAAGNPCITTVPSGAAATAGGGDSTNKTVDGDVTGVPVEYNLAKTCVVNVFTDCTTP